MEQIDEGRLEVERAIVGAILADPAKCTVICVDKGVRSSWFEDTDCAALFEAAARAFRADAIEGVDALGLAEDAKKIAGEEKWDKPLVRLTDSYRMKFLNDLIDAGAQPGTLEHHVYSLRGCVYQQSFAKAFYSSMKDFLRDPLAAISKLIETASETYTAIAGKTTVDKASICAKLEEDEYQSWHMRVDPNGPKDLDWVPGLRTPWTLLTRIFLGIGNRFHIWAARPSVGKTSIAINFARFWADQGKKVLINSLDMPPEDVIDRLRTEKSRVSVSKKRYTPTETNLSKLKEASEWVCAAPIEVCETYYVEDFCIDIAMKAKTGKIDVVIVDYVQLLNSYKVDNANEYERVSYVAEYLKKTANRYKIPLIALCQLNRKSGKDENAEPTLTDLRGSGALEQAASSVVLLHRDYDVVKKWQGQPPYWLYKNESYGKDNAASNIDPIWLIVAKNQNGPTGRLPFIVNKPYFAWKLGNPAAKCEEHEEGFGATKRVVKDNAPKFSRFYRDWRADGWEQDMDGKTYPYAEDGRCGLPVLVDE